MTRICIVGGALQGMEAVFLSGKAGYETVVIDRREDAPALSLCDEPHVLNPVEDPAAAGLVMSGCDVVLPACEEMDLLEALHGICSEVGVPLLFDRDAYAVSSSKLESNRVMSGIGAPLPKPWPECGFPVIVKPSGFSGSVGVSVAEDDRGLEEGLRRVHELGDDAVVQEFVHGKSVSIEVIGDGTDAASFVTTEVILDSNYDCKMVVCSPDVLSPEDDREFADIGARVARAIGLSALMDVEAILTPKGLRVLEIDARIPSQTPAAIWAATGFNLLEALVEISGGRPCASVPRPRVASASAYFHLVFRDGVLRACGEKEFGHVRSPHMVQGLFGSDDAITDYVPGSSEWRGTFIVSAGTRGEAMSRAEEVVAAITRECGVASFINETPEVV